MSHAYQWCSGNSCVLWWFRILMRLSSIERSLCKWMWLKSKKLTFRQIESQRQGCWYTFCSDYGLALPGNKAALPMNIRIAPQLELCLSIPQYEIKSDIAQVWNNYFQIFDKLNSKCMRWNRRKKIRFICNSHFVILRSLN